jgi:hypothetical protein
MGREGEHAPLQTKPEVCGSSTAVVGRAAMRGKQKLRLVREACAGAGGVARTRAAFWKESTGSYL